MQKGVFSLFAIRTFAILSIPLYLGIPNNGFSKEVWQSSTHSLISVKMAKENFKINLGEPRSGRRETLTVKTLLPTKENANYIGGFGVEYDATNNATITIAISSEQPFNAPSQGAKLYLSNGDIIEVDNSKVQPPVNGQELATFTATLEVPSSQQATITSFEIIGIGTVDIANLLANARKARKIELLTAIQDCLKP